MANSVFSLPLLYNPTSKPTQDQGQGGGGAYGSADDTCPANEQIGPGNGGDFRCCKGDFDYGNRYGECETSSCVENFDAPNLTCFNYGSPQHKAESDLSKLSDTKKGGSNNCPYFESDRAICDTSEFTAYNEGKNCRFNQASNQCLGKVKCQTDGVDVPKNGWSDGTATGGGPCASTSFPEGTLCFYLGPSEASRGLSCF